MTASNDFVPDLLDGRYRIKPVIARGGTGRVLEALHVDLDSPVAIKVLRPRRRRLGHSVERLARKAQIAGSLPPLISAKYSTWAGSTTVAICSRWRQQFALEHPRATVELKLGAMMPR